MIEVTQRALDASASPPLVPGDRPIDLVHLSRMTLGDHALERDVLVLFERQIRLLMERIETAANPVAAAAAHTLKGSARGIGAFALAKAAADLLPAGSTVFLDAGSTNLALARALPAGTNLTVATNAPAIAAALLERDIATIQLGGLIDPRVGGAIGAKAMRDAEAFRPDILVLGVCGIAAEAGVTAYTFEDAEFKRFLASRSKTVLVAVTNDKLSTAAPYSVVPLSRVARAVIEADADETEAAALTAAGLETLRAGRAAAPRTELP